MDRQTALIQATTARTAASPDSNLTRLVTKNKRQREILEEAEDPDSDKYTVLRDIDDSEVQAQFFDESVASFENDPFKMGDLVDYLNRCSPAIYIKPGHSGSKRPMVQLLTDRGEFIEVPEHRIAFHSPGFLDPAELLPILPYFPTEGDVKLSPSGLRDIMYNVPRELAAPILAKMVEFESQAARTYRKHAQALDSCLESLGDWQRPFSMTLQQATQRVLGLPKDQDAKPEELWSVHKALSSVNYGTIRSYNYRSDSLWYLFSLHEIELVERVVDWWHEYQSWKMSGGQPSATSTPTNRDLSRFLRLSASKSRTDPRIFQDFVQLARHLVKASRERRSRVDTPVDDSRVDADKARIDRRDPKPIQDIVTHGEPYGPNNSAILRFLLLTFQREVRSNSTAASVAMLIVRETGLYGETDDNMYSLLLFLQEMGVISPWDGNLVNIASRSLRGYDVSGETDRAWSHAQKSIDSGLSTFKDRMADLRKDWSDLEVYCVDSASTTTVDDGFSIERVPGNQAQMWLHVHVANPTAFVDPQHPITKYAKISGSSIYLPNAHRGMIDDRFIAGLTSLDKDRPCLTFSSKLDIDGNILDCNITPGRIRNVKFLTPGTLREAVSLKDFEDTSEMPGGSSRSLIKANELDERQLDDLKTWRRFAEARMQKRSTSLNALMAQAWQQDKFDLIINDAPLIAPDYTTIRQFIHEPVVKLVTTRSRQSQSPEDIDLVQEAMLLAGTVAASWCAKRGIPAPYRIATTPEGMPTREEYFDEFVEPLVKQDLPIPRSMLMEMASLTKSRNSIAPREHQAIGVDAYLRVTSPLRRYVDMLAHYQIEAALLRDRNQSAASSIVVEEEELAYSARQMAGELKWQSHVQVKSFLMGHISRTQWILRYLSTALESDREKLPENVIVRLKSNNINNMDGSRNAYVIEGLRVNCEIEEYSGISEDDMAVGDTFSAEITGVSLERQIALVKLLKARDRLSEFIQPGDYRASSKQLM